MSEGAPVYMLQNELEIAVDVTKLVPRYKSGAEQDFARMGALIMEDQLGSPVVWMRYEPVTFNLPGNRYTPDFEIVTCDGRIAYVEVKGSKRERGYRDARSKLRLAAAMNPQYAFYEWIYSRGEWSLECIVENYNLPLAQESR